MNSMPESTENIDRINDTRRDDCPEWCTVDHSEDPFDDLILHLGDDHTDGTVRKLLDAHRLDIRVARCDSLEDGVDLGTPGVMVNISGLELTTWGQAAELARTILDSFGYLKGADQ